MSISILLTGPTASGKTEIALELAKRLNRVEIISVDSRQVFRYMDIGTAKPTMEQRKQCPHHFIDIINPDQSYNAGEFARRARCLIEKISSKGGIPILVGGTGLYWQSVVDGFFEDKTNYEQVRKALQSQLERDGLEELYEELGRLDPITQARLEPGDTQRILRGLEVALMGGKTLSDRWREIEGVGFKGQIQMIRLSMDRNRLYERIDKRVEQMIEQGLIGEIRELLEKGYGRKTPALGTLGYLEILDYLDGVHSLEEAKDQIKRRTRRFAKRQNTWFRRDRRLRELDLDVWGESGVVTRIIEEWSYRTGVRDFVDSV